MHAARKVYEKILNGDSIEDEELKESLVFFKNLSESLHVLGPVFALPAREASRVYHALDDYRCARDRSRSATYRM